MHWIFAHLIGDFIFQSDWMAKGKKLSSWICALHVCCYMAPFGFCNLGFWQLQLIGFQHFFQDRYNFVPWFMRAIGQADFARPPMAPWSIIVMDQILHVLWIAAVLKWVPGV